jgi:predicted transglutaminase-like cysteine proteinase
MTTGRLTSQPIGHYQFCNEFPDECSIRGTATDPVLLDEAAWDALQAVNNVVNNTILPATDHQIFGEEERWVYPLLWGDCEDYVLLKRRMLAEAGWPVSSLLITVVLQSNGDGHAVLTVRTDRGDLILDNLVSNIRVWNETDYFFVKRQSERDSGGWISIDDRRQTVAQQVGH